MVMAVATAIAGNQAPIDFGANMLPRIVPHRPHDGAFRFCRLRFHSSFEGDGDGWWVDYPRADVNLSIRLAELTRSHVSFDASNDPVHQVVTLADSELFTCGFVMRSEPGGAYFSRDEARAVRHSIFHMLFDIEEVPQIPNIGLWTRARLTSERGADSAEPHFRGIADRSGRLMIVMTHNTDFGDAYERESESPDFFRRFSVPGARARECVYCITPTRQRACCSSSVSNTKGLRRDLRV